MSDDPSVGWYCIHVRGIGEISAWTDPGHFHGGMEFVELEQVSRMMYAPNGDVGASRMALNYKVRPEEITGYYQPMEAVAKMLAGLWGKATIAVANGADLKRLPRM